MNPPLSGRYVELLYHNVVHAVHELTSAVMGVIATENINR